jgi:hypothetical protein
VIPLPQAGGLVVVVVEDVLVVELDEVDELDVLLLDEVEVLDEDEEVVVVGDTQLPLPSHVPPPHGDPFSSN